MINAQRGVDAVMLAPQAYGGGDAAITANLDTNGHQYATIRLTFASEVNTDAIGPTISVLESDDTVVTIFTTVVADRTAEDLTAARALTYHIDLRGRRRFLRLSVLAATHTTNDDIVVGAESTLTRMREAPNAASAMADAAVIV